ncbi:restriction endonuclease subunit R, partial [Candidatus Poribacteria bacterium]|nr:restriction endonuclease subunit R [Candidatus Poribacteria bacterium]
MQQLYEKLRNDAEQWRKEGYPCQEYPLIGEILRWQFEGDTEERGPLKFLREPQFQSLEVYWYLRLVLKTPKIVDLNKNYYGDDVSLFCNSFGISLSEETLEFVTSIDQVIDKVKNDTDYVKKHDLDTAHEAVKLDYPSYIFALAMGSGKTILIATIIATEFAMSLRYSDAKFMKNALVFAPGTTIIESLREISKVPYDEILPPGLYQEFKANLKFEYPQSKAKDLATQYESTYNLIVTNTEKIRLQIKRRSNQTALSYEEDKLHANLRLRKITSLPNLGIFSDEAHHTYGNDIDKELKRVRQTVDYINKETNLIAVINTTGTPYYKKQMLREVVAWYSLGQGINDNILKSLHNGIVHYEMGSRTEEDVISDIIRIFFEEYGDVTLLDGAKAKIAFYFKTQEHLNTSKPHIGRALTEIGK